MTKELEKKCDELIHINDHHFKPILDNNKYSQKSEKQDPIYYREQAKNYLDQLNALLMQHKYLLADHITFADIAIFPFITGVRKKTVSGGVQCKFSRPT